MDLYINGVPRPDSEKEDDVPFTFDNTGSYHGMLDIGRMYLDEIHPSQMGNIKIDELIIWEEVLLYCDVIRLYNAYLRWYYTISFGNIWQELR